MFGGAEHALNMTLEISCSNCVQEPSFMFKLDIWILDKCDIACDIASLRYLSDISCDIFFIAFAISFISYAITNNIAYDIALRYRMRYPYDAISFISHAIS